MQNLSLPATQNAPLKNVGDAANKHNASTDKSAAVEPNTSFQMMLSRQVQAKQAQDKQTQDRQAAAKQGSSEHVTAQPKNKSAAKQIPDKQASAKQGSSEHVAAQSKNKSAAGHALPDAAIVSDKAGTDIGSAGDPGLEIKLAAKKLPVEELDAKREDAETKPGADASVNTLAASMPDPAMLVPLINATPLVNVQGSSSPAVTEADSPLTSTAEMATQKLQSLDTMLSNALSQGKNANVQDNNVQGSRDIYDGDKASEHTRWLDAMLPGAAKQTGSDELPIARSALNELNAVKDSVGKDVVTPAGFQPAAQVNTALSTQQAASTNVISAYPGKPGWDQAISQKVVWMVGAGEQSATLTLNPPDLGPLQVVIHVHNDQADATFISDNTEVRQALEDGMSNLRDKMSESGIQLGQANVSSGGQSQQAFQQATQSRLAAQQSNGTPSSTVAEAASGAATVVRVANGLVDTFA
ncbi:MAG: flagellar hook-length control protein FliK [Methylotenera sp.]